MKIRVLGCSGSIAKGCHTTAFLLNDDVLIDAGTGVCNLPLESLVNINHIFLSHSHLDHILSIALLADSVLRERALRHVGPISIHGLPQTLSALKTHIFNDVIWPDFTCIPSAANPCLRLVPFAVGQVLQIGEQSIEVLSAAHTVPAVGFAVFGTNRAWVYSGDTGPNPSFWSRLQSLAISDLVIEVSFGDEETTLAQISQHLCPAMLAIQLRQMPDNFRVHISHIKPGDMSHVMEQVKALNLPHRISALAIDQVMALD